MYIRTKPRGVVEYEGAGEVRSRRCGTGNRIAAIFELRTQHVTTTTGINLVQVGAKSVLLFGGDFEWEKRKCPFYFRGSFVSFETGY